MRLHWGWHVKHVPSRPRQTNRWIEVCGVGKNVLVVASMGRPSDDDTMGRELLRFGFFWYGVLEFVRYTIWPYHTYLIRYWDMLASG